MSALNLRHFERAQSASERATILAACEEVGPSGLARDGVQHCAMQTRQTCTPMQRDGMLRVSVVAACAKHDVHVVRAVCNMRRTHRRVLRRWLVPILTRVTCRAACAVSDETAFA